MSSNLLQFLRSWAEANPDDALLAQMRALVAGCDLDAVPAELLRDQIQLFVAHDVLDEVFGRDCVTAEMAVLIPSEQDVQRDFTRVRQRFGPAGVSQLRSAALKSRPPGALRGGITDAGALKRRADELVRAAGFAALANLYAELCPDDQPARDFVREIVTGLPALLAGRMLREPDDEQGARRFLAGLDRRLLGRFASVLLTHRKQETLLSVGSVLAG